MERGNESESEKDIYIERETNANARDVEPGIYFSCCTCKLLLCFGNELQQQSSNPQPRSGIFLSVFFLFPPFAACPLTWPRWSLSSSSSVHHAGIRRDMWRDTAGTRWRRRSMSCWP